MTDTPDTPKTENTPSAASAPLKARPVITTQTLTLGISVLALILAAAPYVLPNLQAWQTQRGLMANVGMLEPAIQKLGEVRQARAEEEAESANAAAAEAIKSNPEALAVQPGDPVLGNSDAPIKILAFLDYNCGVCRQIEPHIEGLMVENPDVAVVVKQFPVITDHSEIAARYALAAWDMGKFQEAHTAFMREDLRTENDVQDAARKAGLDGKALKARADSPEIRKRVSESTELGHALGLRGTPAYIIDGVLIPGADMRAILTTVAAKRATLPKS